MIDMRPFSTNIMTHPTARRDRLARKTLVALLLLAAAGCARKGQSLTFSSNDGTRYFSHAFPEAYISRGNEGDLDIFLVEDGLNLAEQSSNARKPLDAAPATPRQIVHIRIVWTPMKGTRADQPAATNAIVHWYVLGAGGANEADGFLHYSGSGFVKIRLHSKDALVDVANVKIALSERSGDMTDPLGPATLAGRFDAKVSDTNVKALLAEIRNVTTRLEPAATAGNSVGMTH